MKKKLYSIFIFSLLLCGLSLVSCNSDEEYSVSQQERFLQITTDIIQTRSVKEETQFEKGDTIGLVLEFEGGYDVDRFAVYDGKNWKISRDVDLLTVEGDVMVSAYYPYHHDGMVGLNLSGDDCYLQTHPYETDYLSSGFVSATRGDNVAKLTFSHLMSRITLSVTKASDITRNVQLKSTTIASLYDIRNIVFYGRVLQGTFSEKEFSQNHNCLLSSEPVIVDYLVNPQSIAGKVLILDIDNKQYTVNFPDITLEKGKRYTFNIVVKEDTMLSSCCL